MVPKSEEGLVVTSGIRKFPTNRNSILKNPEYWLDGKREVDEVFPYWRIHNKLYDLTDFISKHPGGAFWIKETRGTDITESFESSHFGTSHEKILQKYYVKDINRLRNSPFTFHEDGFYKTLKRKVTPILKSVGTGPSLSMILIQDSLFAGFLLFSVMAAMKASFLYAVIAGSILSLMANAAHNFFHQKDNWHMFLFDFTLSSSRDWRISHVLSHHNFPNTIIDFEVSCLEPHLEFFPKKNKSWFHRYATIFTGSILYSIGFYLVFIYRIILYQTGKTKFVKENALPFLHLLIMAAIGGSFLQAHSRVSCLSVTCF
ncbi:Cytochrome b5-related protein [Armadillidium nasatum]|uniref:Cytochrome b5-related protein n=1 Tax=Armadillidium nasatum TaxID=96803 RepID=A0A5N5T0R7_9CRUS|nr:Cytochrome b5-related protein [Armadillidium nasatum]